MFYFNTSPLPLAQRNILCVDGLRMISLASRFLGNIAEGPSCFHNFCMAHPYVAHAHAQTYAVEPCHDVLSAVKMASCLVAWCIQCSVARFIVTE